MGNCIVAKQITLTKNYVEAYPGSNFMTKYELKLSGKNYLSQIKIHDKIL